MTVILHCSIISVAIISQSGHDVLVLVEVAVHGPGDDADLGVLLGHGPQTLGAAHEVQEENIFCLDTVLLKYLGSIFLDSFNNHSTAQTFNTVSALIADPPVASIGSTRMTKLSLIFFGNFL